MVLSKYLISFNDLSKYLKHFFVIYIYQVGYFERSITFFLFFFSFFFFFCEGHGVLHLVRLWIQLIPAHSAFAFLFLYFLPAAVFTFQPVYCTLFINSCNPQISLFSNFFIKNGFHDTTHTFKNYFTTIFLIFNFNNFQFQQQ